MHASTNGSEVTGAKPARAGKRKPNLYRIVRWQVSDPFRNNIAMLWCEENTEGTDTGSLQDPHLKRMFPNELPCWNPFTGVVMEFQVKKGELFVPCHDPRFPYPTNGSQHRRRVFIVDTGREEWGPFANFFESSKTGLSIIDPGKAEHAIRKIGIDNRDMVVVHRRPGDGKAGCLIEKLRTEWKFLGLIYGFAEKPRLQSKLRKAGCNEVFGIKAAEMHRFLRKVFPTSVLGSIE
jgi:hypothetical protein